MLPNLTAMMQPNRSGLCISLETKVPAENFTSLDQRESALWNLPEKEMPCWILRLVLRLLSWKTSLPLLSSLLFSFFLLVFFFLSWKQDVPTG
jgi:hypothetical protein